MRLSPSALVFVSLCCLAVSASASASACLSLSDSACVARSLPCVAEWQWRIAQSQRHSQTEREYEKALIAAAFPALLVTLRVFSGSSDPQWILSSAAAQSLLSGMQALPEEMRPAVMQNRVLGYMGFLLSCPYSADGLLIRGAASLESFLLNDIAQRQSAGLTAVAGLNGAVLDHVRSHVGDSAQLHRDTMDALSQVPVSAHTLQLSGFAASGESNPPPSALAKEALQLPLLKMKGASDDNAQGNSADCVVPVVGPDYPPYYDPEHDDGGCFVTDQTLNNCYAYGCDIVTDTFPQPGRGSGQKWSENTCEDMGAASVRDGLEYVGTTLPSGPPAKNGTGHYVALLIWPDTNFHWIRMDANNDNSTGVPVYYWSHKPGSTPVRNVDNNDQLITNPAVSDFSPWTQFCAYYRAQPSLLKIN